MIPATAATANKRKVNKKNIILATGCALGPPNCSSCRHARQVMNISLRPRPNHAPVAAADPNQSLLLGTESARAAGLESVGILQVRNYIKQSDDKYPYQVHKMPVERYGS